MKLEEAYRLCIEKFKQHQPHYTERDVREVVACREGDYYAQELGVPLFDRYNWTSSFVTGLAPLYYRTERDATYLEWADRFREIYREKVFEHSLDTIHDIGFLYSPYSVAMYQLTGDREHRETALRAADELLKRFDIKGGYLEAWEKMDCETETGRAIVDSMINIQLLLWAWKETGHRVYRDVARSHADTTLRYFVREDGSVAHSFIFDRKDGKMLEESNTCGYANGSWWARGTAWAVYGFAMAARYLKDENYYETALRLAKRYMDELPQGTYVPTWDFRLPKETPAITCGKVKPAFWDESKPENREYNVDSSACAVMACALMELNAIRKDERLMNFVKKSLETLCDTPYLNTDPTVPGILDRQNGRMTYTTYGDFYFVQALQTYLYGTEVCW